MDPVSLATTIVGSFLVPLLKRGARELAETLSRESDSATADQLVRTSGTLWERVRSLFDGADERKALELFERFPEDLERRVEAMLGERLEADEALRSELERLVTRPTPDGASTGAQIMQAHFAVVIDNRNARIGGSSRIIGMNFQSPKTPSVPPGRRPEGEDR